MAIIRKIELVGLQNAERYLNEEVIKPVGKHDLKSVRMEGRELVLEFAESENPKAQNFVKQVSRKKHPNLDEFFLSASSTWVYLDTIKLDKIYLIFFSEGARENAVEEF